MSFNSNKGFTLLEMMVALFLMAIIATLSWRGLNSMLHTREALTRRGVFFDQMQQLFLAWDQDCHHLGSPDQWPMGFPVHWDSSGFDLFRFRQSATGEKNWVAVSYRWGTGNIERWESDSIMNRATYLTMLDSFQKNDDLTEIYNHQKPVHFELPVTAGAVRVYIDTLGWVDNQTASLPAPNVNYLFLGAELSLHLKGANVDYTKSCLTGQN
ncbi:MAG: prepilin-type N-terminal cleavage/methylation domain-containing protein [Ferrovum sp.]|nr:prepilin-type N-terminal cleavage/methylation domain-containing protein [Ferrovum sp.]